MTSSPTNHPELGLRYRQSGCWTGDSLWPTFLATCRRLADREVLVDGDVRLSFLELHSKVERLAAGLASRGVTRGTTVSMQLPNWWETVVTYWALVRLGALVNPILPIYRERELDFILRESAAELLVVPGAFRGFDHRPLAADLAGRTGLRETIVVRDEPLAGQVSLASLLRSDAPPPPAEPPVTGSDLLLLMYTSGTTADPKGVLHTHDTLHYEARSLGRVHGLGEADTVLMPSPLTHVSGLIHAVLLPFVLGTRAVLMESWEPRRALEVIERESVTYMVGAPIFLSDLTYHPDLASHPAKTLRLFSCGGAGVSAELIRESRRRLGCVAKRVYGSTELPTLTTTGPDDPAERGATTEGRVIGEGELRIVDEAGALLPAGEEGEILARGPDCFVGYKNPALDAEAFTPEGWFRTGDLGSVDAEGYLTITGRKKDIIIRKGEKISAAEVESVIARHPAVAEVAIIALPDPTTGERACACVTLRAGMTLSLAELGDFLGRQGLARQKFPEALEVLASLPRTASGKVQKHRLRVDLNSIN